MPHGPGETTGFRFETDGKSIVYATDYSAITDGMVDLFHGADILVSDCLRREPHPTHANLALALELAERCQAQKLAIGRASCRERVCQYVYLSGVAESFKKKHITTNLQTQHP